MDGSRPMNALVVGAPRSGTSLTAGVFARQGYYVAGEGTGEPRDPDRHNPFGYREAEGLIEGNVSLFARVGFPHHNTRAFDAIEDNAAQQIDVLEPGSEDAALPAADLDVGEKLDHIGARGCRRPVGVRG